MTKSKLMKKLEARKRRLEWQVEYDRYQKQLNDAVDEALRTQKASVAKDVFIDGKHLIFTKEVNHPNSIRIEVVA